MVTVSQSKGLFLLIGFLSFVPGRHLQHTGRDTSSLHKFFFTTSRRSGPALVEFSYKWRFEGQAGGDGECRVQAAEDGAKQHELSNAHVHRQAGQVVAQRGQLLLLRQGAQVLQALLGCVQTLCGGWLDEAGEDRLQRALSEHVQDLDSGQRGDSEWQVVASSECSMG